MKNNFTKHLQRSLLYVCILALFASQVLLAQTTVTAVTPASNALNVPSGTTIQVTFSSAMLTSSFNDLTSFVVHGITSGRHLGTFGFTSGNTVATFTPTVPFKKGEIVVVDLSSNLQNGSSVAITPFVYSFTVGVNSSPGTYAAKVDYGTGGGPLSVFVSDIDGDGDGDIVTANNSSNNVSILKNNGDGTYAAKVDYGTGSGPYSVFISDVDGDGDGDLAIANSTSSSVSILKNNGDGTYGAKTDYTTGTSPTAVFISDLDGDGDGDLAVTNQGDNTISILKNNGDGTFAAKVDYVTGSSPNSVFVCDLDGDGDGDLAVANSTFPTVSILKNNGNGTFAAKVDYTTGSNPVSVYISDVDGDGDGDLAVANSGSNSVSILKNNGNGTFAAKVDYATGNIPNSVYIGDVDGDGDGDLAVTNRNSNTVSILKNNGDGTYAAKVDYATGSFPSSVFISDVNGDGIGDPIVANWNSNSVSILKGLTSPKVNDVSPQRNALNIPPTGTILVSFNGAMLPSSFNATTSFVVRGTTSGRHLGSFSFLSGNTVAMFTPTVPYMKGEKVVVDISSSILNASGVALAPFIYSFTIGTNSSPGTFVPKVDYEVGSQPNSVFVHDLDGDGDGDIAAANGASNTVSILKNNGDGTFATKVDYATGGYSTSVFVFDLDGDGDGDIVVGNAYAGYTVSVLKNNGDGTFAAKVDYPIGNNSNTIFVSDVDGDGAGDIIAVNGGSHTISVLKNNGDGTFQPKVDYDTGILATPNYLYVSDIDNDGDGDLIVGNQSGSLSAVTVLKNNGDGTFATKVDYATGAGEIGPLTVSDVDNDGDVDVVVSNQSYNHISVLKNNGDGTFIAPVDYPTGGDPVQVFVYDLDGDGDGDIAVTNAGSSYLSVLKNNADGTFQPRVDYNTGFYTESIFISDVDGDGDGDIVVANYGSGTVSILKNAIAFHTLTVNIVGNGSVTKLPDQPTYANGSTMQLDPAPAFGYLFTGWSGNASGTDDPLDLLMDGDKDVTATFSIDPRYEVMYRTATYNDWATAADAKGKYKPVKRKFDKVLLKFNIGAPANASGFTITFSMAVRGAMTIGKDKLVQLGDSLRDVKVATFTGLAIAQGDTFQFDGYGSKGKIASVKVTWETSPRPIKQAITGFKYNDPKLPMPNLHNVGIELFPGGFGQTGPYFPAGLLVGIPQGTTGGNSVLHLKYSDVQKSLVKFAHGVPLFHTDYVRCLDTFPITHKPIKKQLKNLPPDKYSNKLFAELLTLKLNVAASATNKFPVGLGELTFDDGTDPSNPFNGQLISTIILKADTLISCLNLFSKPIPPTLGELYDILHKLNGAFAGVIDTFSFTAKTRLTGVKQLIDVPFLRQTPGIEPVTFFAGDYVEHDTPAEFVLQQNYPNPFNPTTTISFDLASPSNVSLKIYNMLGQEVAVLLNAQEMEDGNYEFEFNANTLSSGVYMYRLEGRTLADEEHEAGSFSMMKKMLLVK